MTDCSRHIWRRASLQQQLLLIAFKVLMCGVAGVWKMVTGLVDAGEDINMAAEREVLEETGVKASFSAVLAFRQAHGFAFGKSDFFFVIALR
jgi:ADP-ribose pyrophosphatase YjhB (NUDIX family)